MTVIAQAQHGSAQASIALIDGIYRVSVTAGDGVAFLPVDADGMVALAGVARQVVVQEQVGGRIPWLGLLIGVMVIYFMRLAVFLAG